MIYIVSMEMELKVGKFVNWDTCGEYIIISNLLDGNVIKIKSFDNKSIQTLLETKWIKDVDDRIIQTLFDNNVLIDSDIDEDELLDQKYYEAVYDNKELNLVIYPTVACNLRCKYCWEEHRAEYMTESVKESILKYLKREVRYYKCLYISWFGGEPLLDKKFLVDFMQRIKQICAEEKTPLISNITTNGYNLDIDTFTSLVKSNLLYYQITLDGTEEIHNNYRPHVDKKCNSYQTILNNLIAIKQSNLRHFQVTIRVNVSKELLDNIEEFMSLLRENFANDKRFSIIWHPIKDWGGMDNELKKVITEDIPDLSRTLNDMSYEYNLNPFIFKPKFNDVLCSACKNNSYIVNVDGKLEKCVLCHDVAKDQEMLQYNTNKIGYITSDGRLIVDKKKVAKWIVRTQLNNECRECTLLPICLEAVCPNSRKFINTTKSCTVDKNYYKSMLRELLDVAKEIEIK